ncbi:Hypothetical predicted protein [Cloeon dipterum]|uniref:Importin N-terminal domain-containing protein n=2 Tax=Cloeon dipterum TaxID=197152 RepID=A0A8S1D2D9_9INSE|nr:Hypothetical predicted protein [Cloeon dipterum]
MDPSAVHQVCAQLVGAVEVSLDPNASVSKRREAYEACEQFKENSPICAQCGQVLAQLPNPAIIRHFGLQLMEHCIRHRWNVLSIEDKLFIKESSMELLRGGTLSMFDEQSHIKDAIARLIVEMVKREWPQQWPSFLEEMDALCKRGPTQAELALLIFRRLAEDVAVLQTLESNQRRKDIHHALNANMESIFGFFLHVINTNLQLIGNAEANKIPLKLCEVVLKTLSAFVEWVSSAALIYNNGQLLHSLCALLNDSQCEPVLYAAAECLVQILNRKGSWEERQFAVVLLQNPHTMNCICMAAERGLRCPPSEPVYLFLKLLTQVVTGLGSQMQYLLAKDASTALPANFSIFLEVLMLFTQHPSHVITRECNSLWAAFFKHDQISKNPEFIVYAKRWIEISVPKLSLQCMKVGVPSQTECASSVYSTMDFDSDEEFFVFFHRYRAEMQDCLNQVTLILPLEAFQYAECCLMTVMSKETPAVCSFFTPLVIEWEAVTVVLDSVLNKILHCAVRPSPAAGLGLIKQCLQLQNNDPFIMSFVLSSISALFVFLSMDQACAATLPQVLQKIFSALVFALPGQTKDKRTRAVKNVRRHAASLMVKLAQKYPLLLLPLFDEIKVTINNLSTAPDQLSQLEIVTLQEALILVSNHFNDYARQTSFIAETIEPISPIWVSLGPVFSDVRAFMSYVGLDKPPVEPSTEDTNGKNRSRIMRCTKLLFAIIRRSQWPTDPELQAKGGFIACHTPNGVPVQKNPAAPHFLPNFLPQLLALCKTLHDLWKPEALAALSEGYKKCNDMVEELKRNALGTNVTSWSLVESVEHRPQSPLERMQNFLTTLYEHCYLILGAAGVSFGHDFYSIPMLSENLVLSVFTDLDHVPDYRLRSLIRPFLKSFISCCPSSYYEILKPLLSAICPYMYQRLTNKWQHIASLYDNGEIESPETCDTQCCEAVLEDNLNRLLSREYFDLLRAVLIGSSPGFSAAADETMDVPMDAGPLNAKNTEVISDLGKQMLSVDVICQSIFLCVLKAFSWSDNTLSQRATQLTLPLVKLLFAENKLSDQAVSHIMCSILHGLEVQGEHENVSTSFTHLGASVYDILRPQFAVVKEIMLSIPGTSVEDVNRLDEKVLNPVKGAKREKSIRDSFRKISLKIANEGTSKLFQKKVNIKDLRPMPRKVKVSSALMDSPDVQHNVLDDLFGNW